MIGRKVTHQFFKLKEANAQKTDEPDAVKCSKATTLLGCRNI